MSQADEDLFVVQQSQLQLPQTEVRVSIPITAEEWTQQRGRIRQLYLTDEMTRQETRLIMKHRYAFDARDVQYKYQIKKWQFQKSLTYDQKKYVVMEADQLPGNVWLLCGKRIQKSKLSRQRKETLATKEVSDNLLSPANLSFYDPDRFEIVEAIREVRSISTARCSDPKKLQICCVTCVKCEIDIFSQVGFLFWSSVFDEHLINEHANTSHKFAFVWCAIDPASKDAPDYQIAYEWNYTSEEVPADDKDLKRYDHYPSAKQMVKLLDSMSSASVIQEEPEGARLWLVDRSYDERMRTLASISRWSDQTPRNLLQSLLGQSLLNESSSQADISSSLLQVFPDARAEYQFFGSPSLSWQA